MAVDGDPNTSISTLTKGVDSLREHIKNVQFHLVIRECNWKWAFKNLSNIKYCWLSKAAQRLIGRTLGVLPSALTCGGWSGPRAQSSFPSMAAGLGTQGTAATPGRRPHGCYMVHRQQSSCGPCTSAGQPGTGTATAEKEQSGSPVHPEGGDSGPRGAETPPGPACPCPEWTGSPRLLLPRGVPPALPAVGPSWASTP